MKKSLKEIIFAIIVIGISMGTVFGIFGNEYTNFVILFITFIIFLWITFRYGKNIFEVEMAKIKDPMIKRKIVKTILIILIPIIILLLGVFWNAIKVLIET